MKSKFISLFSVHTENTGSLLPLLSDEILEPNADFRV